MNQHHKCIICKTTNDDVLNLGELKRYKNIEAHYYCLLLASTIKQSGRDEEGILGFLPSDINDELKQSQNRICVYCNKKGASVICNAKNCKLVFHLPCGIQNGSGHQFFGRFISFCTAHRPRQKFAVSEDSHTCAICYELINFFLWTDVLWAPCCKKESYFHKKCLQQMALSAGYFFKCPICNNVEIFKKTMKLYGVFVPDRDASWELVPNAYEELYYRHDECNIVTCLSPKGRYYRNVGPWNIVLCNSCGSQGTHVGCSKLRKDQLWFCNDCSIGKDRTENANNECNLNSDGVQIIDINRASTSKASNLGVSVRQNSNSNFDKMPIIDSSRPSTSRETQSSSTLTSSSLIQVRKRKRETNTVTSEFKRQMITNSSNSPCVTIDSNSDSDVMEIENEPSSKYLVRQNGSELPVKNIDTEVKEFLVGGLNFKKIGKPFIDSDDIVVINEDDCRSSIHLNSENCQEIDIKAVHSQTNNSQRSNFEPGNQNCVNLNKVAEVEGIIYVLQKESRPVQYHNTRYADSKQNTKFEGR